MTSFARTIAIAALLVMVTPSAAALQDKLRPPSETNLVVAAVLAVADRMEGGAIVLDSAGLPESVTDALRRSQRLVERALIVGPRARYLRCEIVCRVVGAHAVISVASSAIAADGRGTVTVQSWQGGAESPRGASESGLRVRLAPSETHPLGWEVEAIDPIFVS
jgi:hypothetical protein